MIPLRSILELTKQVGLPQLGPDRRGLTMNQLVAGILSLREGAALLKGAAENAALRRQITLLERQPNDPLSANIKKFGNYALKVVAGAFVLQFAGEFITQLVGQLLSDNPFTSNGNTTTFQETGRNSSERNASFEECKATIEKNINTICPRKKCVDTCRNMSDLFQDAYANLLNCTEKSNRLDRELRICKQDLENATEKK